MKTKLLNKMDSTDLIYFLKIILLTYFTINPICEYYIGITLGLFSYSIQLKYIN